MVEGAKVVKVFNHEEENIREFERRNEKLRASATEALTHGGRMVPVIVSISYLNYAISACIGGLFAISGLMDLGSLSSYLVYVRQTAMPINQFTQQMNFILAAVAGAERIFEVIEEAEEEDAGKTTLTPVVAGADGSLVPCRERDHHWAWSCPDKDGKEVLVPMRGDVRFHDVSFSYEENHEILHKLNLYAKPGQKIAFVGSTGAGKTTITNLINRFYEINQGVITYDGIDIKQIKRMTCAIHYQWFYRIPIFLPEQLKKISGMENWMRIMKRWLRQQSLPMPIPLSGGCQMDIRPCCTVTEPIFPRDSASYCPLPVRQLLIPWY